MQKLKVGVAVMLLAASVICGSAFAQVPLALAIAPSKVTMLVGESHTFRAVGKDGLMRHNIRWSVSPEHAATLTVEGDEATLQAIEPSSAVLLTAYAGGDSAQASVEILSGTSLPMGTVKWSVTALPGCKTAQITPAVPSAGGPDVYVQEECPDGVFVRAITDDGRELWRRRIGGSGAPLTRGTKAKEEAPPAERLNLNAHSLCDAVTSGMTKDEISKLVQERSLRLEEKERQTDNWVLEEPGFRCTIRFDSKSGTLMKKKKTLITD